MNSYGMKGCLPKNKISDYNTISDIYKILENQYNTYSFDVFGELKNSCAVASMMNLWKIFSIKYNIKSLDDENLLKSLHASVGSGPILPYIYNKKFIELSLKLLDIKPKRVSLPKAWIYSVIDKNIPVILLIRSKKFDFHYVQVLGYDENDYLICDNWSKSSFQLLDRKKVNIIASWYYEI